MYLVMIMFLLDKDVKLRLQEVAVKSKEYVQKEKKLYSAMFNINS